MVQPFLCTTKAVSSWMTLDRSDTLLQAVSLAAGSSLERKTNKTSFWVLWVKLKYIPVARGVLVLFFFYSSSSEAGRTSKH